MLPIFRAQPGFVRYGLILLDDGSVASVSVWETRDEAEAANASAPVGRCRAGVARCIVGTKQDASRAPTR
jgi:hypothetical protein